MSESKTPLSLFVICPECGGDGMETCTNPDHGFLSAMGSVQSSDVGRLGCPACGHDPKRKVRNGGPCFQCHGSGIMSRESAEVYCKDMEFDLEELESIDVRGLRSELAAAQEQLEILQTERAAIKKAIYEDLPMHHDPDLGVSVKQLADSLAEFVKERRELKSELQTFKGSYQRLEAMYRAAQEREERLRGALEELAREEKIGSGMTHVVYGFKAQKFARESLAADPSGQVSPWLPIETAPRDGTRIILWFVPNEVNMPHLAVPAVGWWKKFQFIDGIGKLQGEPFFMWQSDGNLGPMSFAPTHWMPLPKAPEERTTPKPAGGVSCKKDENSP